MANGSGAAIAGVIIGIIVATQIGAVDGSDNDASDADVQVDENDNDGSTFGDGDGDSGSDGDSWDDDDPQAVPTQVDGGSPGMAAMGAVASVGDGDKVVALTFSSGPHPVYTAQVLDILDRHGVAATFCVTGEQAWDNPQLVRRVAAEGHALCGQGLTQGEIDDASDAIEAAVSDVAVSYVRASDGEFSSQLVRVAESSGYTPLGWSLDADDLDRPRPSAIVDRLMDEVVPGDIVMLHDGGGDQSATVAALDGLITELQAEGYELVLPTSR